MFFYTPKKSKEIYKEKIAHRGFHKNFPENTMPAYNDAINRNYAIELDIRLTKDKKIICIHDRYARRLLGIKGKISNFTYYDIERYNVLNSDYKVPTLSEVLKLVNGKKDILIEVKGYLTDEFKKILLQEISGYTGNLYFHSKNIFTYFILKNIFKNKVFWVLNPFRKRFNFIKAKNYKFIKDL